MKETESEVAQLCLPLATPWTVAHQASPSMGFSRLEYWSGVPLPSPGDLPDPGIKAGSSALRADALPSEPPGKALMKETEDMKNRYPMFIKPKSKCCDKAHTTQTYL